MVNGVDLFRDYFREYQDQYIVIGGMACDLLLSEAGLDFRATQDIDVVLIVEALSSEFARTFWQFIEDGGYEGRMRSNGTPEFYRFVKPTNSAYPKMIELFSRPQTGVTLQHNGNLMPLHFDDEIPSLSAILLNDDYYRFLIQGRRTTDGISLLDALYIIPLKMKAWLDLMERKAEGQHVNARDLKKHPLDVFRLFALISPDAKVLTPASILLDIQSFVAQMRVIRIGLESVQITRNKDSMLDVFERVYIAE